MNDETKALAERQTVTLREKFLEEVERLCRTGAVGETTSRALIFGVALENLADNYLGRAKCSREHRNLRKF